ncbi:MAG: hypothetical protein GYA62_09655 [Bacteroidales bacterium]|nr:hypothetical protein [Bacteroidales bacterium]
MVPILIVLFLIAQVIGMKQMERAVSIVNATMTGDTKVIEEADGSASARITPVINTVKNIDLEANETWFGKGTRSEDWKTTWMENNDRKLDLVEQYGLIAFIISLIFVYSTMIRNFLSIESLIFIFLLSASLVNLYYTWAIMMLFATIRYFQQQNKYSKNVL